MSIVLQKKGEESETMNSSTVDESNQKSLPPMISETEFEKIANSSYIAFSECLDMLDKNHDVDIVEKIHTVLLSNDSQNSSRVLSLLPRLLQFLSHKDLYDAIVLVLCDISHLNAKSSKVLLDNQIFDRLDLTKNVSFSFIFSICDENKEAWSIFTSKFDISNFANENITRLVTQYKE